LQLHFSVPFQRRIANFLFDSPIDYLYSRSRLHDERGVKIIAFQFGENIFHPPRVDEVEDFLREYVRALDNYDHHIAFLELWTLLERLTATKSAKYDNLINRTAFIYPDREIELHKLVLEHLKMYRNSSVHDGVRKEEVRIYVYQLKRYVERLIKFHVFNVIKSKSLEETIEFLDVSTQTDLLKHRVELFNRVIKFRSSF
jgi:hypothetical protein